MPVPTPGDRVCWNCHQPASRACVACKDAIDDDGKAATAVSFYYCNRLCQRADWPRHKGICAVMSARRELQRAADTLQQIWYACRAEAFPFVPPVKVEERNGAICWHHQQDPVAVEAWRIGPFPDGLVHEERDRKAVLAFGTCAMAAACMDRTTRLFLEGLCVKLEEFLVDVLPARPINVVYGNGNVVEHGTGHQIVLVTQRSRDTDVFALDFSGAQYGYDESVLPISVYVRNRIDPKAEGLRMPLGTRKAQLEARESELLAHEGAYGGYSPEQFVRMPQFIDKSVENWCKREEVTLSEMLKLPEDTFRMKQQGLIHEIEEGLRFMVTMEKRLESPDLTQKEVIALAQYLRLSDE